MMISDTQLTDIACVCKAEKVVAALKTCVPAKCKPDEVTKFEPTINSACKGKIANTLSKTSG
jgi:hypothetical protein